MSGLEAFANTFLGWFISFAAQLITFPLFGIHISMASSFGISLVFIVISICRGYMLRRFFNYLHTRKDPYEQPSSRARRGAR
jgi:hypothetical protein